MSVIAIDDAGLRGRSEGRLVVLGWHGPPQARAVEALTAQSAVHHAAFPDGVVIVSVASGGAPDAAARASLRNLAAESAHCVLGMVVLIETTGFKAVLARNAANVINLSARLPFRIELRTTADEAALATAQILTRFNVDGPSESRIRALLGEVSVAELNAASPSDSRVPSVTSD